jgi:hypothetical protein
VRRAVAPIVLAARRVAARPRAVLLTAAGIAVSTAALVALLVGQVVVEDRAVSDAIMRLPVDQRTISVSWVGLRATGWDGLDRDARSALGSLRIGEPIRSVSFRSIRAGTEVVRLAAVDDPKLLIARSGRLPSRCGRSRCDLVVLDGPRRPLDTRGLEVVGSTTAAPGVPLHLLVGAPSAAERLLLASGIDELARRPEVDGRFRTLTWLVPLDADTLDSRAVATLPRQIAEIDSRLRQRSPEFAVRAPLEDLAAARERAARASRRQLIVAGEFAVAFLAFAVLAASSIRRSAQETRFRLRRLRALRWQIVLESVAHAVAIAIPAVLAGSVLGFGVGAVASSVADRPAGDAVLRTLESARTMSVVALLAVAAVAILVATASAGTLEVRGRGFTSLDIAAAAALAAVVAALAFGETDADALARDERTGSALLLLPVLIALAGALVIARVLPPVLRAAERATASAGVSVRLALLSIVRNPGTAGVAVACLAVTTGMGVFALSYRATLEANQRDAAAYAAPLGYVVASQTGANSDLASHYGPDAHGVVRRHGAAPTLNRRTELRVLGLPADAFRRMRWRDDHSDRSPEELARAVAYRGGGLRGISLPRDAEELLVPRTLRGDSIELTANVRRPDGGFADLELKGASRSPVVRAPVPRAVRGGTIVALTLEFPPIEAVTAAHRASGSRGAPDVFRRGVLTLERPRVRAGAEVHSLPVDFRTWVTADGAAAGGRARRLRIRYFLTQAQASRLRPRQPTDVQQPIPVIASTSIAEAAGSARVLPVRVGDAELDVRIAATARRFPTLSGDFLVADRLALATAANASSPGAAVADEAWLPDDVPLRRPAPFPVRITSRAAIERSLRADPVSRATSIALLAAAVAAACLALAGIALALAVDVRDGAAELFDLESLGLAPARLARHLWLRAAIILSAGIAGGLVTGAVASAFVTEVVAVTANATTAEPPLITVFDWPQLLAAAVVFCGFATAAAALLARRSFRAATPARPEAA